jgi:hypothetical protein
VATLSHFVFVPGLDRLFVLRVGFDFVRLVLTLAPARFDEDFTLRLRARFMGRVSNTTSSMLSMN